MESENVDLEAMVKQARRSRRRAEADVQASLAIVFHHFTAWAKFDERNYDGQKFSVAKYRKGEISAEDKKAKADLRAKIREESSNALETLAGDNMFANCEDVGDY